MKKPDTLIRSDRDVKNKLLKLEVSLNHQLNVFFRLAPAGLRSRFFSAATGATYTGKSELFGREIHHAFQTNDITQPDLFFAGDNDFVSIELKIKSKSSLEQMYKYCVLHLMAERAMGGSRRNTLIYVGEGEFSHQWKEKFEDVHELMAAFRGYALDKITGRKYNSLISHQERVREISKSLVLGFMSYAALKTFLLEESEKVDFDSEGGETLFHLLAGIIQDLNVRGLA